MNKIDITKNYIHSEITERIIKIFFEVYTELGCGFLEKIYENAMVIALQETGFDVKNQYP